MASLNFDSRLSQLVGTHWTLSTSRGSASDFHQRPIPEPASPEVWVHSPESVSAVVGSSQRVELVGSNSAAELGIEVSKRRSGGGLVIIEPATSLWVDLILPASHQLWEDDISRSFDWLGAVWAGALLRAGHTNVSIHEGPATDPEAAKLVCFASCGAGEVSVGGRKVVGLSQRRNRIGARYQCLVVTNWPHHLYRALLGDRSAGIEMENVRAGTETNLENLLDYFLKALSETQV